MRMVDFDEVSTAAPSSLLDASDHHFLQPPDGASWADHGSFGFASPDFSSFSPSPSVSTLHQDDLHSASLPSFEFSGLVPSSQHTTDCRPLGGTDSGTGGLEIDPILYLSSFETANLQRTTRSRSASDGISYHSGSVAGTSPSGSYGYEPHPFESDQIYQENSSYMTVPIDSHTTGIAAAAAAGETTTSYPNPQPSPFASLSRLPGTLSSTSTSTSSNVPTRPISSSSSSPSSAATAAAAAKMASIRSSRRRERSLRGDDDDDDDDDKERDRGQASADPITKYGHQLPDGTFRCAYPNCSSHSAFRRACDLRKHYNQHRRHLFCRFDKCPQSVEGGFSSKKDRARHEAKHNPGVKCERGCGRVFSRVDNMKDHVKRIHLKAVKF